MEPWENLHGNSAASQEKAPAGKAAQLIYRFLLHEVE